MQLTPKQLTPNLSDSLTAARSLLGWEIIRESPDGITSGYIVETEAYDMFDPASHAFGGKRPRNSAMYESAGTIYVYLTYGMHYCMNIVTGNKGHGQGVLIRALEPNQGIDLMKTRRGIDDIKSLTNGPAKLTKAMGIKLDIGGTRINQADISLKPGILVGNITQTTRIGISKAVNQPWRFYITDNPFVSRK